MSDTFRRRTVGSLNVIEKITSESGPSIVILHGYGADAADLANLSQAIKVPRGTNWIFPDGPLEVPTGPHSTGRAWFPIDMEEIEKAMMTGTLRDMTNLTPPGLENARTMIIETLDLMGFSMNKTILGGFSQGAMLATDITMHSEDTPQGLAILSGTLIDRDSWADLAPNKKGLKFFQSHGRNDPVLGYSFAQDLNTVLTTAGLLGKLTDFNGGHEIPPVVIDGLQSYIAEASRETSD